MSSPTTTGIIETVLYVDDLDRSVRFYQDLLGLPVEFDDELICVMQVAAEQALILFPKKIVHEIGRTPEQGGPAEGTIPPHGGDGRMHVAFGVADGELGAWQDKLDALGIEVESRVRWPRGGTSLYFRDPDGHSIELLTRGLWSFH